MQDTFFLCCCSGVAILILGGVKGIHLRDLKPDPVCSHAIFNSSGLPLDVEQHRLLWALLLGLNESWRQRYDWTTPDLRLFMRDSLLLGLWCVRQHLLRIYAYGL